MPELYASLNDVAAYKDNERFKPGQTKIWYFKDGLSRDMMMGHRWLAQHGMVPNKADLEATHVCVGAIDEEDPNVVFQDMQAEYWSPAAEARGLITTLGLSHTSMSVGDIIQIGDAFHFVDSWGFISL